MQPVPETIFQATLPFLSRQVAAIVELQLLTGMRPGEVTVMRTMDLETGGKLWVYRPGSDRGPAGKHKTPYRGRQRAILLGPKAQEIVRPWLRLNLAEYLFQPREACEEWEAEKRKARRSKVTPSQAARKRKARPKKAPGEFYQVSSYDRAVSKACERAGVPHWHPHQLRHTKATEIRREAGLDAARAVLGHSSAVVTELYAEADMRTAADVMERLG